MPAALSLPTGRLRQHLICVVVAKVVAIIAIYLAFFSPAHRVPTDPGMHIAGPIAPLR